MAKIIHLEEVQEFKKSSKTEATFIWHSKWSEASAEIK